MTLRFKNKVGLITGSSRGIGKATAIELCAQGATIILNGRTASHLQKTRDDLIALGFNVIAIKADITKIEDCNFMIEQAILKFGKLDFIINNGSLTMNDSFDKTESHIFENVFVSNALGAVFPTMAALPYIKAQKGSVLFISSLAGLHGMPSASAYSAGKMALTALWQSLTIELSHTGVHFGICYLGFTENDVEKRMLTADGSLVPVPKRPAILIITQKQVAKQIARTLHYRKARHVISTLGKITAIVFRIAPKIALFIMVRAQKKK
ncbi:MAG: SDR family NAD(P)-dependent oxidoreductase [Putridiphycobacter sp.]|nr:SDR family NAD(P)-dependent oxidoreductase [Putridiphycobacter sp.]